MKSIVVGVTETETSQLAARRAVELAVTAGATVHFVTAVKEAQVEVLEQDARTRDAPDDLQHLADGEAERFQVEELGTDVAGDADGLEVPVRRGAPVELERGRCVHAELVLAEARRHVRVGLRVHVGVHADRDRRDDAQARGDLADALEFRGRFDVDGTHPCAEGRLDLGLGLPDPREDDLRRIAAGREDAGEFPAGDDVEAEALPREEVEDREVPVGLHGEADEVRATGEGGLEGVGGGFERRARVDVGRGAEGRRDVVEGDVVPDEPSGLEVGSRHGRGLTPCR